MKYSQITTCEVVNGIGMRVVLWVSGCSLNCKGCHNPEQQSFAYGKDFTTETLDTLIAALDKPYIEGLTISGGHALEPQNAETVLNIINTVRDRLPDKTIWLYTGLTYEQAKQITLYEYIIHRCDVLVDGAYIAELRDTTLAFRGSSNQRIIDVKQSYLHDRIVLWGTNTHEQY